MNEKDVEAYERDREAFLEEDEEFDEMFEEEEEEEFEEVA